MTIEPLAAPTLPGGVRARIIPGINGLAMHVLEAGYAPKGRPLILLLHGFPELAWSWRKVMLPLAAAGYHVVAPDQRGYGRTTGWTPGYDVDLREFCALNVARDAIGLVAALGHRSIPLVVGHDFGALVAATCALVRPDIFRSVVLMSAPYAGPPPLPFDFADGGPRAAPADTIDADLAALPRPRKHYHRYYSTREADANMRHAPQGIHAFLRAYYHHKSADWAANRPHRLDSWSAGELAKLPTYYIMDLAEGMAETVAYEMPTPADIAANRWLGEDELRVYSSEFARTGFQGGLNWYRCRFEPGVAAEMQTYGGRTIDVPSAFISGKSDWGVFQRPHDAERMRTAACTRMIGFDLIDGAGHWVQQERPDEVVRLLLGFLDRTPGA